KPRCNEAADHEQRAASQRGHPHLEHLPPVHQRTPGLAFYRHGDAESRRVRGELQGGVRGEERRGGEGRRGVWERGRRGEEKGREERRRKSYEEGEERRGEERRGQERTGETPRIHFVSW